MAFGERINNPLNLRDFGTKWTGYVGPYQTRGNGTFARFDSPENGYAAAFKNMRWIARKKGAKTVGEMINVWAPPADNNNTSAYVQRVAQMSGLSPNTPIPFGDPSKMTQLAKAMTAVELGKTPFPDNVIQTAYQRAFAAPGTQKTYGNMVFPPNYNPNHQPDTSLPTTTVSTLPAPQPTQAAMTPMLPPPAQPMQAPGAPPAASSGVPEWLTKTNAAGVPNFLMALGAGMLSPKVGQSPLGAGAQAATNTMARLPQQQQAAALRNLQMQKLKRDLNTPVAPKTHKNLQWIPGRGWQPIPGYKDTPLVNIDNKGQNAFVKKRAEMDAKSYGTAQTAATNASDTLNNIAAMRSILPGIKTGPGAATAAELSKWGQTFGVNVAELGLPENAGRYEAFQRIAMNFVMQRIKDTKGAISEAEMRAFAASVPGLSQTPEGINIMLGQMEKVAQRKQEYFSRMQDYAQRHNGLTRPDGPSFMQEWKAYTRKNPIFKRAAPQGYKKVGKSPDGRDVYEDSQGRRFTRE